MDHAITHVLDGHKGAFVIDRDGARLATMTYSIAGDDTIIIDHTEVDKALHRCRPGPRGGGGGLGTRQRPADPAAVSVRPIGLRSHTGVRGREGVGAPAPPPPDGPSHPLRDPAARGRVTAGRRRGR